MTMPGRIETKVVKESTFPPTVLGEIATPGALVQLLEWDWPRDLRHLVVEHDLMVELLLPPFSNVASANFPAIAPGNDCGMGTLFIRYPEIAIRTQADGGVVRLLRTTFTEERKTALIGHRHAPSLAMMQKLMNIRSESLRSAMRLLLREIERPQGGSAEAAAALVQLIEVEVARLLDEDSEPKAGGRLAPWQFRRVRERLDAGGPRPSVPELAALCGISVRHLHRQFLNLTGVTISDYAETHMVNRAKAMLAETDMPVKAIAEAAGFDHPNSFSRTFRRAAGVTPQEYRQRRMARQVAAE